MADRIVVLREGRIEQAGTPQALYERPCNTFVAGFIGSPRMNFIPASHAAALGRAGSGPSAVSQLGVRPEHLRLAPQGQGLALTLRAAEYLGANCLVQGDLADGTRIETLIEGAAPGIGQTLWLQADAQHVHAFDAQGLRLENLA